MEAHLKNKHALAVCEAIWSEDAGGNAPLEDPSEVKKPRNAGEDIPNEKIIQMTDMARDMGAKVMGSKTWTTCSTTPKRRKLQRLPQTSEFGPDFRPRANSQ